MASTAGICNSFKTEIFSAVHNLATDVIKIALYTSASTLIPSTTTGYTTSNEVVGTGYTAGGVTATGNIVQLNTNTAAFTLSNVSWASSTITACYALVYNSSKSNKAMAIIDFGGTFTDTNGTFTIPMPAASVGLITFS
jgi:hypothetical protein